MVAYATANDPWPIHTDEGFARQTVFGGITASFGYVVSLFFRAVHTLPINQGSRGHAFLGALEWHRVRFRKAVVPDDRLRVRMTITSKQLGSKGDRETVKSRWEVINHDDEVVVDLEMVALYRTPRRPTHLLRADLCGTSASAATTTAFSSGGPASESLKAGRAMPRNWSPRMAPRRELRTSQAQRLRNGGRRAAVDLRVGGRSRLPPRSMPHLRVTACAFESPASFWFPRGWGWCLSRERSSSRTNHQQSTTERSGRIRRAGVREAGLPGRLCRRGGNRRPTAGRTLRPAAGLSSQEQQRRIWSRSRTATRKPVACGVADRLMGGVPCNTALATSSPTTTSASSFATNAGRRPRAHGRSAVRRQINLDVLRSGNRADRRLAMITADTHSCGPRCFHDCLPSPSDLDFIGRSGVSGAAVTSRAT